MRRTRAAITGLIVIGVLSAGMALTGASAGEDEELQLFTKTTESSFLDVGEEGLSLGDQFIFHDVLRTGGERVGHAGGVCTTTSTAVGPQAESSCQVTLWLSDGQIATQGLVAPPTEPPVAFDVAITGGTGRYQDATGQLHVKEITEGRARLTLHLDG
jgi:hypothetical protein